jgi:hypothetical protein
MNDDLQVTLGMILANQEQILAKLDAMEGKPQRWLPGIGDSWWVWRNDRLAYKATWDDTPGMMICYRKGNVHPTKEAAEAWGKEQD